MTSKKWITTINNPNIEDYESLLKIAFDAGATYVTGQLEVGESGTAHLQIFTCWPTAVRGSKISKFWPRSANFPVKKDNGTAAYCNKEEGRMDGPWTFGEPPKMGRPKKSLLEMISTPVRELVKAGMLTNAAQYNATVKAQQHYNSQLQGRQITYRNPKGIWYHGVSGVGKSRNVRELFPGAYIKDLTVWWEQYEQQQVVLLEDYDHTCAQQSSHNIKIWSDAYQFRAQVKGSSAMINYKFLVVTSQYLPKDLWQDSELLDAINRRFKFVEVLLSNRENLPIPDQNPEYPLGFKFLEEDQIIE